MPTASTSSLHMSGAQRLRLRWGRRWGQRTFHWLPVAPFYFNCRVQSLESDGLQSESHFLYRLSVSGQDTYLLRASVSSSAK